MPAGGPVAPRCGAPPRWRGWPIHVATPVRTTGRRLRVSRTQTPPKWRLRCSSLSQAVSGAAPETVISVRVASAVQGLTRTVRCSSSPGRGRSSRLGGLFFGGRQKGLGGLSLRAGRHGGADLAGQWTRCPGHLLDAQFVAAKKPVELRCAGIKQPGQSRHDHEWSYEHSGVKVQAGQRRPQATPGASGSGGSARRCDLRQGQPV